MASVRKNYKNGEIVSYTFTVCLGRDPQGKQIRRYKNWTPPKGIGPAKAPKEAEKQAALWEQSLQTPPVGRTTIDERTDDFTEFIEKIWLPLQVRGSGRKAKTIQFYESTTKTIETFFKGRTMIEIHDRMPIIASEEEVRPYLSDFESAMDTMGDVINGAAATAYREIVGPEYRGNPNDSNDRPNKFRFDRFIDRGALCTDLISKAIEVRGEDDEGREQY